MNLRIDIEVAHPGKFVIYIENKIWAGEGDDETNREWRRPGTASGRTPLSEVLRVLPYAPR